MAKKKKDDGIPRALLEKLIAERNDLPLRLSQV